MSESLTAHCILTAMREDEDHSYFAQTDVSTSKTDGYLT